MVICTVCPPYVTIKMATMATALHSGKKEIPLLIFLGLKVKKGLYLHTMLELPHKTSQNELPLQRHLKHL